MRPTHTAKVAEESQMDGEGELTLAKTSGEADHSFYPAADYEASSQPLSDE